MRNSAILVLVITAIWMAFGHIVGCHPTRVVDTTPRIHVTETPPGDMVTSDSELAIRPFESDNDFQQFISNLPLEELYDDDVGGALPCDAVSEEASESNERSQEQADSADESITNTQEAGVDEGGIVKTHGDHLVVLRRGRLFSMNLANDAMRPISAVDVFPPNGEHDAWYDEMLIHGDRIVVVGYSYEYGGTELGIFNIDDEGVITHDKTFFMTSSDYYSSRNYASRLLGNRLIFYMPYNLFHLDWSNNEPRITTRFPGIRNWSAEAPRDREQGWSPIIEATSIYQSIPTGGLPLLHTIVTCDLESPEIACTAQGILGPYSRNFYVSHSAVYVWVTDVQRTVVEGQEQQQQQLAPAMVFRLPLDGSSPTALRVWGAPTDQFSFKESDDEHLNVLVRAESGGDWMWSPEMTTGGVALLRVPLSAFSPQMHTTTPAAYTILPAPASGYVFQNRFVGDHVLYGTGSSWYGTERDRDDRIFIHPFRGAGVTTSIALPHGVDRIEALGRDAVIVGADGRNLHFTALQLGTNPAVRGNYVQRGAAQGETRSHGFFFKPTEGSNGVLGLPIVEEGRPGYRQLWHGSASVLFLRVSNLRFSPLGELDSRSRRSIDDHCRVSCVDWYGNARPIFYRGRVFALLGYELVEGRLDEQRITEIARSDFLSLLTQQIRSR